MRDNKIDKNYSNLGESIQEDLWKRVLDLVVRSSTKFLWLFLHPPFGRDFIS